MHQRRPTRPLHALLLALSLVISSVASVLAATDTVTNRPGDEITLTAPAVTNATMLTVKGQARGAVAVTVAGVQATVGADGAFTAQITLKAGANKVEVAAKSADGKISKLVRTITVDTSAVPMLTALPSVNWVGTTPAGTKVTFDGQKVAVGDDDAYRIPLNLARVGSHTFHLDFEPTSGDPYYHEMRVIRALALEVPAQTNLERGDHALRQPGRFRTG